MKKIWAVFAAGALLRCLTAAAVSAAEESDCTANDGCRTDGKNAPVDLTAAKGAVQRTHGGNYADESHGGGAAQKEPVPLEMSEGENRFASLPDEAGSTDICFSVDFREKARLFPNEADFPVREDIVSLLHFDRYPSAFIKAGETEDTASGFMEGDAASVARNENKYPLTGNGAALPMHHEPGCIFAAKEAYPVIGASLKDSADAALSANGKPANTAGPSSPTGTTALTAAAAPREITLLPEPQMSPS